MLTITTAESREDIEAVRTLLAEYFAWVFDLSPEPHRAPTCADLQEQLESLPDRAPTFAGWQQELDSLPRPYALPSGCLLLARYDGEPAGCVALKCHDPKIGELKRMYVRPAFRGRKIAPKLVAALIAAARDLGYRRIILDSHITMVAAHAVYESAGFRRIETPAEFPDHLKPYVVFMELSLG